MAPDTGEPIEDISVSLSVRLAEFYRAIDDAVEAGVSGAEEVEDAWSGAGDGMDSEMNDIFKNLEATMVIGSGAIEEAAQELVDLGQSGGRSVQELIDLGKELFEIYRQDISDAVDMFVQAAEKSGKIIDEPTVKRFAEYAKNVRKASSSTDGFRKKIKALIPQVSEEAKWQALVEQELGRVVTRYKEMGIEIGKLQLHKMREELERIVKLAKEAGLTSGEAAAPIRAAADRMGPQDEKQAGVGQLLSNDLQKLGRQVLGVFSAYKLLSKGMAAINRLFKEGIVLTTALSDATWRLNARVALAQNQFGEVAGTQAEWLSLADELVETLGIQREKALETAGAAAQLGAQFKLGVDQTRELTREGAAFAIIAGQTLPTAVERLIQFVATGRGEFRELDLNLSDTALTATAASMEIAGLYSEMDEATQEAVRFQHVMDALDGSTEIAETRMGTFAGQMAAIKLEAEESKTALGLFNREFVLLWERIKLTGIKVVVVLEHAILNFFFKYISVITLMRDEIIAFGKMVPAVLKGIFDPDVTVAEAWADAIGDTFDRTTTAAEKVEARMAEMWANFADIVNDPAFEDAFNENASTVGDWSDAVIGSIEEARKAMESAELEWFQGLRRIDRRFEADIINIQRRFSDRRIAGQADYYADLKKINSDAEESRRRAIENGQRSEMRLREDHIRRIRDLEESLIFDLEDAIRARDAKAVFLLQRRFAKQRMEENRNFEESRVRIRQDVQYELNEVARALAVKRALRVSAYKAEMAELRMQERAAIDERVLEYDREKEELQQRIDDRLMLLAHGYQQENELTVEELAILRQELIAAYGQDGWALALIAGFTGAIERGVAEARDRIRQSGAAFFEALTETGAFGGATIRVGRGYTSGATPYARGGEFVTTGPRLIQVGEVPERVTISPLSREAGNGRSGDTGGGQMRLDVRVSMEEGLVAEIVDKSLNATSDIFVEASKQTRRL